MIKKGLRSLDVGKPLVQIIWGTVVDFSQWVPHSMNTYISDQFPAYPLGKNYPCHSCHNGQVNLTDNL